MAAIQLSSLFIVGQQAVKYCGAAVGLDGSRPSWTGLLPKLRHLMAVLKADYARFASSSVRAWHGTRWLGENMMTVLKTDYARIASSRELAAAALCFALNIPLITVVAALLMSAYGFVAGLYIVVLAVAPVLLLLNIVLSLWIDVSAALMAMAKTMRAFQSADAGGRLSSGGAHVARLAGFLGRLFAKLVVTDAAIIVGGKGVSDGDGFIVRQRALARLEALTCVDPLKRNRPISNFGRYRELKAGLFQFAGLTR